MRILFVADLRSPTARNWIDHFVERGDDVHAISTFPLPDPSAFSFPVHQMPLVFAGLGASSARGAATGSDGTAGNGGIGPFVRSRLKSPGGLRTVAGLRAVVGPLEIRRHVAAGRRLIESIRPDLVHAMRIPYEGMFAARATPSAVPLLLSVWGNDFTLHAAMNHLIARETRHALSRADALHTDCQRDLRLAARWGYDAEKSRIVLPGAGGIHTDLFHPGPSKPETRERWSIPEGARVIVNPRGVREYVRSVELIHAFARVVRDVPDALLICPGTAGHRDIEQAVRDLGLSRSVRLGPVIPHAEMADLFRAAEVTISPSLHDGTPNSLLESMACGCFPVAGEIESIREWIDGGINGLLCDVTKPEGIASSLTRALNDRDLRIRARTLNLEIVRDRANYDTVMAAAACFYERIATRRALDPSFFV